MSPSLPTVPSSLSRRRALAGATTVGLGLPLLSACGGSEPSTSESSAADPTSDATTTTPATGEATTDGATTGTTEAPAAGGVVSTADVPVGGGVVLADEGVVVTQPAEGEIKVFDATCTHTGCLVTEVADGEIVCPCHMSHFDITSGDVVSGPAPSALPAVDFTVDGDQVVLS